MHVSCVAAWALALAALLGVADVGRAQGRKSTLAEYRGRVERAAASLAALAALTEEEAAARRTESWARAEESGLLPAARERTLREVRALVPSTEQVARGDGGTLEVDNRWLYSGLADYERQQESGPADRAQAETLDGLAERLRSLGARLLELEGAPPAQRDKEAEKGRLASILRGPDFAQKDARGGARARIIDDIMKWLRDLLPEWEPIQPGPAGEASKAAQFIIYALVAAVIAFVAWHYWRRRGVRAKRTPQRREPRVILGERLAPEQTASDLLDEAEHLARAGNLRGAIRKAYIALLCELGDRRVVRLAQHKTNRDYLQSVRQSAPQTYGLFQPLTQSFERHWYGLESATEEDWDNFRNRCRRALEAG